MIEACHCEQPGFCQLAGRTVSKPIHALCRRSTPEQREKLIAGLKATVTGEATECKARPCRKQQRKKPQPTYAKGTGTFLHERLESIGLNDDGKCRCKTRAKRMDVYGPDWCEQNIDQIVGWLHEEATRRSLPFLSFPAKMLVQWAIGACRATEITPANVTDQTPPAILASFLLRDEQSAFPAGWETWPNAAEGLAIAEHERQIEAQTK